MPEETKRIKAVVLDRKPFREHDLLVMVYSKERGREQLIARGARKFRSKIAAHVEPLCFIDGLIVIGKNKNYLGSAMSAYVFPGIKSDLDKLSAVGRGVTFFRENIRDFEADEELFNELIEYLIVIDKAESDFSFYTDIFIYKVLSHMGYGLDTGHCRACKRPLDAISNKFEISTSTIVHNTCGRGEMLTISQNCAMLLSSISSSLKIFANISKFEKIDNETRSTLGQIINCIKKGD